MTKARSWDGDWRGPVLSVENISKSFPGIKALDDVSLDLDMGEALALVGENGAGKSTLINIITGVYKPDEGVISVGGEKIVFANTRHAFDEGIAVVFQERNLIPTFSVAENICIDEISGGKRSFVDRRGMASRAASALELVQLDLSPDSSVESLSSAQKQMIEIARALARNARILILDEPTASISQSEVGLLLDTIRNLKAKGVGIIYVSHKLEEVFAIADKIMVLRDGRKVGETLPSISISRDELIIRMVGRKEDKDPFPLHDCRSEKVVLEAESISAIANKNENSFQLRKGEILGWYGLVGSGRTELARELIGIDPVVHGRIFVHEVEVAIKSVSDAFRKNGIYYISENRKEEGLFLIHSIAANIGIVALDKILWRNRLISYRKEKELAERYHQELSIKMQDSGQTVSHLSGGNQQKICIAKGLVMDPEIIIIDEPTVGIDVKTKGEIHRLIHDLALSGKSIILITSDLPEMIRLADRILVFWEGHIVGEIESDKDYDRMSSSIMGTIIETGVVGALHRD